MAIENKFKRLTVSLANGMSANDSLLQAEIDSINTEQGTIVSISEVEDLEDYICTFIIAYNVTI